MSNNLPYEEIIKDQLAELPLPDENLAWEDMRRRLEEEDDHIIPAWWRSCGLWSLAGLFLLALGWWLVRPEKWWQAEKPAEKTVMEQPFRPNDPVNTSSSYQTGKDTLPYKKQKDNLVSVSNDGKGKDQPAGSLQDNSSKEKQTSSHLQNNTAASWQTAGNTIKKKEAGNAKINNQSIPQHVVSNHKPPKETVQTDPDGKPVIPPPAETGNTGESNSPVIVNTGLDGGIQDSVPLQNNSLIPADSVDTVVKDSVSKTEKTTAPQKDSTQKEKLFFSAGLGLQQQIPTAGQQFSPYSSLGRKNLLTDYIPSVYFQANKPGKWFANIGFRYGAPQYNKAFLYDQNIRTDTGQTITTTTTSLTLKKTFYHQLPLTFNYYILPRWSMGTGIVWNKFYGAVADREVIRQDAQQTDTLSKGTVSFRSDSSSSFSKSYFQALLETEYHWKRFYFGARYSFGLQPYIRFTLPGSTQQKEKSSSLQLYIRYDLWQSKKE